MLTKKEILENKRSDTHVMEIDLSSWARWMKFSKGGEISMDASDKNKLISSSKNNLNQKYSLEYYLADQINQAIQLMPLQLRNVVKKYYLSSGSVQSKASELNMTRVTFHEYLRVAKYWLLGYYSNESTGTW